VSIAEIDYAVEPQLTLEFENPIFTHIIDRGDDERSAAAIVLEARVMGTPITALCGHTWVPSRDPAKYPVCPKCVEILEFVADFRGITGGGES